MQIQANQRQAVVKIEGSAVLVLSPYPESATFGCGGAILRHIAAADRMHVIVACDGQAGADAERSDERVARLRQEACDAAQELGHDRPEFWALPGDQMEDGDGLARKIAAAMDALACDLVYAPSLLEPSREAAALGRAALAAVQGRSDEVKLAFYEIEVPAMQPNVLLDIGDLQERKRRAVACFTTRIESGAHDRLVDAINSFRTYPLGPKVKAAEAFLVAGPGDLGGVEAGLGRGLLATTESVAELKAAITRLEAQLLQKDEMLRASEARLNELWASTSWKFAAPIRWLGRLARYVKSRWLRPVYHFVRRHASRVEAVAPFLPGAGRFGPAFLARDAQGKYSLVRGAGPYTYVEPQCPPDLEARIAALGHAASFSIVVPVYNTPTGLLDALVDSVKAQWYPHWQLILADDASPSQVTRDALDRIDHPKIKVVRLEDNRGIAGATNAAIAAADGEFVLFADHDDELTVDCLYELALCVARDQPDFIYSDEDKLDEHGAYVQPHFKPDWSPDTMMSTMFTGHVSCVRSSLLARVGPLRTEVNGCQDWDLVLRIAEHTRRISHVPKVLYHWRIIPASVASDIAAKPYVLEASKRVRSEALARRNVEGTVEPVREVPGYFRVNYHLQGSPLVSIIVPTRDGGSVLRRCVESVFKVSSYRNFEIVVLDNGSVDPMTLSYLRELGGLGNVRVVRHDKPFNFSELNNIGAANAKGELLLFLNDDTEVIAPDWLERMGGYAQLPHVGAVGAKLVYPQSSRIQHAGVLNLEAGPVHAFLNGQADMPGYFMRNLLEYNWLAVTGACLMMEAKKFQAIGAFDLAFPVGYNDIELCMRAYKKGLFNVVCQAVTLVHHESVSRGLDAVDPAKASRLRADLRRLHETHPNFYQFDPFHNPNLDPAGSNFEVAA